MIIVRPSLVLPPPTLVASTLVTNTSTVNNSTIAVPTHQAGDLLLLIISSRNSISSTPAGYSQVLYSQGTDRFLMVLQKVATSSEPTSVSVTISDNTRHQVDMLAIRGGVVDVSATEFGDTGVVTTPALAVPNGNTLLLRIAMHRFGSGTVDFIWPSPLIEISDHGSGGFGVSGIYASLAYNIAADPGNASAIAPSNITSNSPWAAATIAIRPQ